MIGMGIVEDVSEVLGTRIMGSPITIGNLIIYGILMVIGILLARFIPDVIVNRLNRILKGLRYDMETRRLAYVGLAALSRYLRWIILAFFFLFATFTLGIDLYASYNFGGTWVRPIQIMYFALTVFIVGLFIRFVLSPLSRVLLHMGFGPGMDLETEFQIHRIILRPLQMLLTIIGIAIALSVIFGPDIPYREAVSGFLLFLGILASGALMAAIAIAFLRKTYGADLKPPFRFSPVEKLVKYLAFLIALCVALVALGVDIIAVAASLGLIGFALAFGMQDMVANIVSGITLAVDRPFNIGDRIKVGERWGDVVDIGLRSTRILTPEGELVIIPNNIIATQEVWNYTMGNTRLEDELSVPVSYRSDIRLAEKILLESASSHPKVIRRPRPYVWVDGFGDSSMDLKLRYSISDARDRFQIRSDLLKQIKERFDIEGVEIPFPHRTIVHVSDLPEPASLGERSYTEVRTYFSEGQILLPVPRTASTTASKGRGVILVPMGAFPFPRGCLDDLFRIARSMNADLSILYISRSSMGEEKARKEIAEITKRALNAGISVNGRIVGGDPMNAVVSAVRDGADAVVLYIPSVGFVKKLIGVDLIDVLTHREGVPVIALPTGRRR